MFGPYGLTPMVHGGTCKKLSIPTVLTLQNLVALTTLAHVRAPKTLWALRPSICGLNMAGLQKHTSPTWVTVPILVILDQMVCA